MARIYKDHQLYPYTVMLSPKMVVEIDKIAQRSSDSRGHIMRLMIIQGINGWCNYPIKNEDFDLGKKSKKKLDK